MTTAIGNYTTLAGDNKRSEKVHTMKERKKRIDTEEMEKSEQLVNRTVVRATMLQRFKLLFSLLVFAFTIVQ